MNATITLPTKPERQQRDPFQRPILLYGRKKSGKSTTAAEIDPEHTLFLATEEGHSHLTIMRQPITSWTQFLEVARELAKGGHGYKLLVVDTIDELARMCEEYVVEAMRPKGAKGYFHISDLEWGKGYDAVAEEFRLKVANLCRLGMGVVFISHTKESTVKTRTGAEITKYAPDVGKKGMRNWLLGFVDAIAFADVIETREGKRHVLQVKPSENTEAGMRVPKGTELPDLIALDANELRKVLELMGS